MIKFIQKLLPPPKWRIPLIFLTGIFLGLGAFLFYVSKAHTYLNDDPATCMNCHIMAPQYSTWFHSSHRDRAVCNDCHVPHNNFFNHYYFKAKDGLRHATIFTLRAEPQVIFIKEAGQKVVQQNCIRCHPERRWDWLGSLQVMIGLISMAYAIKPSGRSTSASGAWFLLTLYS